MLLPISKAMRKMSDAIAHAQNAICRMQDSEAVSHQQVDPHEVPTSNAKMSKSRKSKAKLMSRRSLCHKQRIAADARFANSQAMQTMSKVESRSASPMSRRSLCQKQKKDEPDGGFAKLQFVNQFVEQRRSQ